MRYLHTAFYSGCPSLHSHLQCTRAPFLHILTSTCCLLILLMTAILTGVFSIQNFPLKVFSVSHDMFYLFIHCGYVIFKPFKFLNDYSKIWIILGLTFVYCFSFRMVHIFLTFFMVNTFWFTLHILNCTQSDFCSIFQVSVHFLKI